MPVYWVTRETGFPPVHLSEEDGLLGVSDTLEVEHTLDAYRQGIFPWYNEPPVLWFCPPQRMVLFPGELKVSRSLRKVIRSGRFEIRWNSAFGDVMRLCGENRDDGTWINPEMTAVFAALHERGYAHSVESWQDGVLVGGLYGLSMGRTFCGESMFFHQPDASKVAFVALVERLQELGFLCIDAQQETPHLARFGAAPIERARYLEILREGLGGGELLFSAPGAPQP